MLYDSDAVRTRAPSISSLSPPLSLSLWAYDLYTSNVIKQLFRSCAYKFFRVFLGRMQKIPQSKFFYRAA